MFLRTDQGLLGFLGFFGFLRVPLGSLGFLLGESSLPGIVGLKGFQSCFLLLLEKEKSLNYQKPMYLHYISLQYTRIHVYNILRTYVSIR